MEREKLIRVVTAAQGGDSEALNTLFNEFYNDVYYFALKTVKDSDLACDITQETFVEIINTLDKLQEPAAFVTWMKQITWHQCTRYFKKKKDVLVDENEEGNTIFDTLAEDKAEFIPDEALDQQDFRKTIMDMIDQLSEEQRAATMLYYFDELSVKQIADIQGCSEGTVKSRLNYARKSIKASVEAYEKKNGVKLHCVGVLPLLLWLWGTSRETMSATAAGTVAQGVTAATGTAVAVSAGTATATTAATGAAVGTGATGAGILAKIAELPLVIKAVAVVVAGAIAVGCVAVAANNGFGGQPINPTTVPETTASTQTSSQTTTPATEPTVTPTTEPITAPTTELTTEPTIESATEPTVTEPTETNPSVQFPVQAPGTGDVIPAGCTYVLTDGTILTAGERMPGVCTLGDEFITQDYIYKYQSSKIGFDEAGTIFWTDRPDVSGWGVSVRDHSKGGYGDLLSEVNGMLLLLANHTFGGCKNMVTAPELPASIIEMERTFAGCTSLISVSDLPDGVTSLYRTFQFCSSLKEVSKLPANAKDLVGTFEWCESLVTAPEIPDGVETMENTFTRCTSLKVAPLLPDTVTNMWETFACCDSLVEVLNFPKNATNMYGTFNSCMALKKVPASIPEGVTNMYRTFHHCQALSVAPDIPGTVVNLEQTFSYCYTLQKTPAIAYGPTELRRTFEQCTSLMEIAPLPESLISMHGTFEGCSSVINPPEIPESVTDMVRAFGGCSALVRMPKLPQNVTTMTGTFAGCTSLIEISDIPRGVVDMAGTFNGCESLTVAPRIPSSVTNMRMTFAGCTQLSGIIEIDATPEDCFWCFDLTTLPIALTGSGQNLWTIAASSRTGNVLILMTDRPENSYYDYTSVSLVHGEATLRPYYIYYSTDSGYTQLNVNFDLVNGLDVAITDITISSYEIFDANGNLIATDSPGKLPDLTVDSISRHGIGFVLSHSSLLMENADLTGITCKIEFTYQPVSIT